MCPLVTVVIPVYNVEKYLDRCIQSVVNQSYQNLEIILVDDGSPDRCPAMCDAWATRDARIKVVHKQNAGLGMARNTGLEHSTGEYICFFDSDDYVDPDTVKKCVTVLLRDCSDAVVFGCTNDFGDRIVRKKLCNTKLIFEEQHIQDELIPSLLTYSMGFGVSCCMKMFRTKAILDNHLRFKSEREIISEDAIFILELFPKLKSVSILAENLYFYFKNESSLTNQYRTDRQSKNDVWLQKALETAHNSKLSSDVLKCIQARYQMYTIAAVKQLCKSDFSRTEKSKLLKEFFHNPILRSTLHFDVFPHHKRMTACFFAMLKFRCYLICRILLYLKVKKS